MARLLPEQDCMHNFKGQKRTVCACKRMYRNEGGGQETTDRGLAMRFVRTYVCTHSNANECLVTAIPHKKIFRISHLRVVQCARAGALS